MNTRQDVKKRTFRPKNVLIKYVYDTNLEGVIEDGEWTPKHCKIVDALIAGSAPYEFRKT